MSYIEVPIVVKIFNDPEYCGTQYPDECKFLRWHPYAYSDVCQLFRTKITGKIKCVACKVACKAATTETYEGDKFRHQLSALIEAGDG